MRAGHIAAAVAAVAAVGACSAPPEAPVAAGVDVPQASTLSPHQQAVLASYEATGDVNFEDYATAQHEFLACLEGYGFRSASAEVEFLGVRQLTYSVEIPRDYVGPDGDELPVVDQLWAQCSAFHADAVTQLYFSVNQHAGEEALAATYEPLMRACLADHGSSVGVEATWDDVLDTAWELSDDGGTGEGPDCLTETGYSQEFMVPAPPAI